MTTSVFLNNDRAMPLLGLGLYKTTDPLEAENAIAAAVQNGYRLLDTASAYKNEEFVGRGIAKCGIPRKDLFVTTKIWNNAQRLGDVSGAFQRSLDRLGLDYIDLYLIHWPVPGCYLNTWQEMEGILESGRARAIGVSNFEIRHLEELRKVSGIVPAVNQIECHPLCYPKELIEYCQENGIQVQAYAPLARGAYLDNDILCVLGTKYAHTPAQVGLRWAVQKGISVIPKSVNPERIASNSRIFDFTIDQEDMDLLDTLNQNFHSSSIPEDLRDIAF
nr:aldo/keto reductase [uncultured Blautia sp.]